MERATQFETPHPPRQHRWIVGALMVAFLWLGSTLARGDEVQTLTSWTTGLSGPDRNTSGSDRLLVFTAGMEATADRTIVSVTFGGQPLTQVITTVTGSSFIARAYMFYLDEAAIQAATSNTFSVTWSGGVDDVCYAARMYGNVNQNSPIRNSQQASSASSTPNPIATPSLTVEKGDYVVAAAQCGNAQTYTWYSGFVEGTDQTVASSDHSTADFAASSNGTVSPSADNTNPNRQVILGAALASTGSTPRLYYVRADGSDSNAGDGPAAGQAWRTASSAFTQDILQGGDTVYVMAGTYVERIQPDEDGTSGNPIRVIADSTGSVSGWPAGDVILQSNGEKVLEFNTDNYWYVHGFKISGNSLMQGILVTDSLGVELSNCEIYGSREGIRAENGSETTITNCIVRDSMEEGIYTKDACTVSIWNCTVAHNAHDGIEVDNGTVTITNSIFAYNGDDGIDRNGGSITHTYNLSDGNGSKDFEGTSKHPTESRSDPMFVDAVGRDYHLQAGSPAINSGTDAAGTVDDDLDGLSRPIGASWDMGCYEYPLIGHWQFEEGVGVDAVDSSGNGYDGTLVGGADWVDARCGYAVELDGFGDWVDLGQVEIAAKAYTVAAWFKTSNSGQQTIFAATKAGTTDHLMLLEVGADGRIRYLHRYPTGAAGGTEIFSTDTYASGRWHCVTAVKNSSTMTLHVDGLQVAQAVETTGVETSVDIVAGISAKSGGTNDFKGSLDEIRLYSSALSPTEASALYGMVGCWKLDETSGNTAADSTNYANDGALQGSPTWRPDDGTIDGALELGGSADYVSVPNATSLQITDALTISAWIKGDAWSSGGDVDVIARKGEGNPNNYQLAVADGTVTLYLDEGDNDGFRGDTDLSTGTWYHVAATWDGSKVLIYVDGVLDNGPPNSQSGSIGTDTRTLYIGGRSGTDLFDGLIDDIRIYSRRLCVDEIADLYGAGRRRTWRINSWVEIDKPGS